MIARQLKSFRLLAASWLFLSVLGTASFAYGAETHDRFVIQSENGDVAYAIVEMPEGWHLERLPNRQDARDSLLLSPIFGDLPTISIDVFDAIDESESEDSESETAALLAEAISVDGTVFMDSERECRWSRQVDDRLVTVVVDMNRADFRYQFRFLGRKSQRPVFEPTIVKIIDTLMFSPQEADVDSALKSLEDKKKNLKQTIQEKKWSDENQPSFEMTLDSEVEARWTIWITVFVVVSAVLVGLIAAERILRRRQEKAFAQEITDYMDERRTPRGYDRVSPHFKPESETPPTLKVEDNHDEA